ncbi:MAG: hypothetical protein WAV28_04180 [Sedimentisphaerales bacterium]
MSGKKISDVAVGIDGGSNQGEVELGGMEEDWLGWLERVSGVSMLDSAYGG